MYRLIVKLMVKRTFARLSAGDYEGLVERFGDDARLHFLGSHALGGERRGREQVREWFRTAFELFPGLELVPDEVVVAGPPWNTRVATRFDVRAPREGGRVYANRGMQFLRLRWGRPVEDLLFEDTQRLVDELERSRPAEAVA
jgi:ketosteroid isomerase-like protein